jgi:hypothetical protein
MESLKLEAERSWSLARGSGARLARDGGEAAARQPCAA